MILLDTNVISEAMNQVPAPAVMAWIKRQRRSELWTCTIVVAEIFSGLDLMPQGRRQLELRASAAYMFSEFFPGRILDLDQPAAHAYGKILAGRKAAGRPIDEMDALIAATASVHGSSLATRNTHDFEHCGVFLIDPWSS